MLDRSESVAPPEKFISDNLTHRPSITQSVFDNFALGGATPGNAINSFDQTYQKSPDGKTALALQESIERGNQNPEVGWTQWGANEIANMTGQALNPINWMLGEVGGVVGRGIISGVSKIAPEAISNIMRKPIATLMGEKASKYIPETIGKVGEEKTLSMALLGQEWTHAFGVGAGVMLPQAVVDNYNAETGKHDMLGIAKSLSVGGFLGIGISTIPFAWGILKANINRARARAPGETVEPGDAEKAYADGVISKDTYDYWKEMEEHKNNPDSREANREKLKEKSSQFVASHGHTVNHAEDTASFEILNQDQIQNLQSATADQLVSDNIPEEHRTALSDFMVNSGIDEMKSKPGLLDGVRGYVEYADQNLSHKDEAITKADQLVDQHLNMEHGELPFSQESLVEMVKKHGKNDLPFTVPESVSRRIEQESKIYSLEKQSQNLFEKYEQTGDKRFTSQMREVNEKIESLRSEMKPLKRPVDELEHLREKLTKKSENGKLNSNIKSSPEYRRLQDLADVWHPAKTLLDRIDLEYNLNQQEAYRDLAKTMLKIADQNVGDLAKGDTVKDYLKARNSSRIDDRAEPQVKMEEVEAGHKLPTDHDAILAEQDRIMEQRKSKLTNDEYEAAKEKFKEFKGASGILKSMINCVLGAKNAQG